MKYTEFTSEAASGSLKTVTGPYTMENFNRTNLFHVYEGNVIPALLQTPEYRFALSQFWSEFLGVEADMEQARAITSARGGLLEDDVHQFVFLIDERALHHRLDDSLTMMGQIDHLFRMAARPNVSIGVIPQSRYRVLIPSAGFWIFDRRTVAVEIPNATIEITDAPQVHLYLEMFSQLSLMAQFDRDRW